MNYETEEKLNELASAVVDLCKTGHRIAELGGRGAALSPGLFLPALVAAYQLGRDARLDTDDYAPVPPAPMVDLDGEENVDLDGHEPVR